MASDATGLFVVDVLCGLLADFCIGYQRGIRSGSLREGRTGSLYTDEVDVVGGSVHHGPEGH